MTTLTRPAPDFASARVKASSMPSAPARSAWVCEATFTFTAAGPTALPEPDLCPDAGAGATHTGRAPALTGLVTGTTRVLGEGLAAAFVGVPDAPVGLSDELGDGAVVDTVLPDSQVRGWDTYVVPAVGHPALTARYRLAAL